MQEIRRAVRRLSEVVEQRSSASEGTELRGIDALVDDGAGAGGDRRGRGRDRRGRGGDWRGRGHPAPTSPRHGAALADSNTVRIRQRR
jgi:hypothetical protein